MRELNLSKKKLEFKTDLDHTQECERFSCCKMFTFVRNEISNIILRERCSVLTNDTSFSPVNFFLPFLFIRNCFMCCLSVSSNEYFWIVGRIKLENHTVELTGLAYILAMSLTIFLASVVESQRRCHAKFRDRAWDKKGIVSVRRMACSEWPHVKYFGSLIILSELIDVSLVILTLNDA